jgi:enamine deaminase RidA (YjgF/YER057c/UK114 family)
MERRRINPWQWQDALGFSQAVETPGAERVVHCAGQTSVDGEGNPQNEGDMRAQIELAFANLETVLGEAGLGLGDVVRLTYYTTDVDAFLAAHEAVTGKLSAAGAQPASTLLGVSRLAFPQLLVEIEATAVA